MLELLKSIDAFAWGPPLLILLVGTGIYLTMRLGLLQVLRLPKAFQLIFIQDKGHGDVSSFAALCTALASTVGTGNIIGVATAIKVGGPGALFWYVDGGFLWNGYQVCGRTLGHQIPHQGRPWCSSGRSHALYPSRDGRKVATTCCFVCSSRSIGCSLGNRNLHPSQLDYRIYPKYNDDFASHHSSRLVCLCSDCSLWWTQVYF